MAGKWLQYERDAPVSKSYIVVPDAVLEDENELARWVEPSVAFVLLLPALKSRARKTGP